MKASIPGPCSPIELSMPLGVSDMRGVARPARGFSMMLLVTIAPSSVISKKASNSRPAAAHPLAVKTGLGKSIPASSTPVSACSVG